MLSTSKAKGMSLIKLETALQNKGATTKKVVNYPSNKKKFKSKFPGGKEIGGREEKGESKAVRKMEKRTGMEK